MRDTLLAVVAAGVLLGGQPGHGRGAEKPASVAKSKPLTEWIKLLRTGNATERWRAANMIAELGPEGAAAVPQLMEALNDKDLLARLTVHRALGRIGRAAIPSLIKGLGSNDKAVRLGCASALGYMESTYAEAAVPALREAIKDTDPGARVEAAAALAGLRPNDDGIVLRLLSGLADNKTRLSAIHGLGKLGPKAKIAVRSLTLILKDDIAIHRTWAAQTLAKIGPSARAAVPALVEMLKAAEPEVRLAAIEGLTGIGLGTAVAVPALAEALTDSDESVRESAADALGEIGSGARAAVPALMKALGHSDGSLRSSAAMALGGIGPDAKAAVPALAPLLKDKDKSVRTSACYALRKIGPAAAPAVPALIDALKAEGEELESVMDALGAIGPNAKAAFPAVFALAQGKGDRTSAIYTLGEIGAEPEKVVPFLIETIKGPNKLAAVVALGGYRAAAVSAVPKLREVLVDPNMELRVRAAVALWEIDKDRQLGLRVVEEALGGASAEERLWIATLYLRIGQRREESMKLLVAGLTDKDLEVRFEAFRRLKSLGREAKTAVPALAAALQDVEPRIRDAAKVALMKIDPDYGAIR